jgi:hypothetical protein
VRTRLFLAALAAVVVVAVIGVGGASAEQGHQTKYATITKDCINSITGQDEGDITYTGPVEVWPPNHKYVSATITVTDDDAEPATDDATASVAGRHDQVLEDGSEMTGTGNTDPATDVKPGAPGSGNPTATTGVEFRAERSGHKWTDGGDAWRGRTYTFTVMGTTDSGLTTCNPVDFTATVPHDQGNHTGSSTTASKKLSAKAKARALRLARSR